MTKYKSKFTGQQIDDGIEYGVRVTQQTFSSAQKQQARENIGVTPEVQVGGNTPASDSGVKLFVDEDSDDTVEVYTKAQADGQFVAVVNMNTEPTESTLTYTSTDGTTKNFKVGDEVSVPDAEADNGYTFYKLYALTTESNVTTAVWDKVGAGEGSAAGLEIVAASGTTLNAEVGKYYRYDSVVSTLAVTLPTITGATEVQKIMIFFVSNTQINFTISSQSTIVYTKDLSIVGGNSYEITFSWVGNKWIVSYEGNVMLPDGAIPVEYIEGTGTQYIDTGHKPTTNMSVNLKISLSELGTLPITGDEWANNHPFMMNFVNVLRWHLGSSVDSSVTPAINIIYTIYADNGNFIVNSANTTTTQASYTQFSNNMLIFGPKQNANSPYGKFKLFSYTLIEGNNVVADFIPVRVGQAGCLYDKVSKQLFENAGTGTFLVGSDI